jgi:hypothetical protein
MILDDRSGMMFRFVKIARGFIWKVDWESMTAVIIYFRSRSYIVGCIRLRRILRLVSILRIDYFDNIYRDTKAKD